MINTNVKTYHLSSAEIEALLQSNYGSRIQPVDHDKLNKLRREQQRLATLGLQPKKPTEVISTETISTIEG